MCCVITNMMKSMLIAHSMGSIDAYDVLREPGQGINPLTVSQFVTIGSPLGLAHVKRKFQLERPDTRFCTTSIVSRSWVNYADRRDYVALDSHRRDVTPPTAWVYASRRIAF